MTKCIEIVDRRTGEEWEHVSSVRVVGNWRVTVRNKTTGQVVSHAAQYQKFALLDALIACGCPRKEATDAVRNLSVWN